MFTWGAVIFVGLWLVLRDVNPVVKAKLMGNPLLIHLIVIGSGLLIHGGSAVSMPLGISPKTSK